MRARSDQTTTTPTGRHRRPRPRRNQRLVPALGLAAVVAVSALAGSAIGGTTSQNMREVMLDAGGVVDPAVEPYLEPEHLEAVPVGPEEVAEPVEAVLTGMDITEELGESGIPAVALQAYMDAADRVATTDPSCGIRWTLLAAIGRVESDHGRFGGAKLQEDGYGTKPIRGIPLDGRENVALIRDSDGGALDGDTTFDRAVGPMQFIPSTWASFGVDADDDGKKDPNNIFDAAAGAAEYLCDGDGDLTDPDQAARAVRRYNNADEYVRVVLNLAARYERGEVVDGPPSDDPADEQYDASDGSGYEFEYDAEEEYSYEEEPEEPAVDDEVITALPADPAPGQTAAPAPPAPAPPAPAAPPAAPPAPPAPAPTPEPPVEQPAEPPASPAPDASAPTETPAPDESAPAESPAPTEPAAPEPSDEAPAPEEPPATEEPPDNAAVGWAPAMREVVVKVLTQTPPPPADVPAPAPEAPAPAPEAPAPPAEAPAEPPAPAPEPVATEPESPAPG